MHHLQTRQHEKGIAALAITLILGGVIVEFALAGMLAVTFLNSENFGVRLSAQALANAQSGFDEAFLRVIRHKNIPAGNNYGDWNHISLNVSDVSATAVVCKKAASGDSVQVSGGNLTCVEDDPLPPDNLYAAHGGIYEIWSRGSAFTKRRQIVGEVAVDPVTGVVTLQRIEETPYAN